MEFLGLGLYMISACVAATLIWHDGSPIEALVHAHPLTKRMLMGTVIGLTIVSIIYSPLGKRSGGHINPAMTLTFWWLGKIKPWDVVFYITAQFLGAVAGVWLSSLLLTNSLADPAVNYVVTEPGSAGILIAFVAEFATVSYTHLTLPTICSV